MVEAAIQDPGSAGKGLGAEPSVHPTAVLRDARLGAWCEVGARTRIAESSMDDYSYVGEDADIAYARIGRFCSLAALVRLNPGNHPLQRAALHHFTYRSSAYGMGGDDPAVFAWRRASVVELGHDVWIGHAAVVLPGVRVGTGGAVGAGAVVTRDVAPFTVVAGVPARVIRVRFAPETAAALERIAWWHWPHERLHASLPDFRSLSAEEFCAKHDPGR
jgi:phosphonate metabolism protein (transferase hexapeptide repeat family)